MRLRRVGATSPNGRIPGNEAEPPTANGPLSTTGEGAVQSLRTQIVRNASTTLCPPNPNESFSTAMRPSGS
ncbi:hypothetical protein J2Z21_001549 [Streptomyces griseochromogenes]|uniref:Uncharacterized protein n=1 Tax=Streptomyces griseochromogenes TaxID=68214 RepID=A0ABS4LMJ6_9ACTN|nr:hypothetical protein [Streptomyces griseochromogenes]